MAITDVRTLKEFRDLKDTHLHEYFQAELDHSYKSLMSVKDEVSLRQLQGRTQLLAELVDLCANADSKIERAKLGMLDTSKSF